MRIEQFVLEHAGQQFSGKDFADLCRPGVYAFLCGEEVLYIGMGSNALTRCSQTQHSKRFVRESCDTVKIFPCVSIEAARELEEYLISVCKPKYNQRQRKGYQMKLLGLDRQPAKKARARRIRRP